MSNQPIGIFDSGIGGTSIWKELKSLLPNENTIYLADSKHAPYGEKKRKKILELSIKNTELLLEKNCKLIVVACNTATTNAISYLRAQYKVPFIGIEPAIKPAALQSKTKVVGVLATKGTLYSSLFHSTAANHAAGIKIIAQEGTGLVPLIESGKISSIETRELLTKYLRPMLAQDIDALVLGCTHYPYLIPVLKELLPKHIRIIDSGEAVAKQTKVILGDNAILNSAINEGMHQFFTNADTAVLESFLVHEKSSYKINHLHF